MSVSAPLDFAVPPRSLRITGIAAGTHLPGNGAPAGPLPPQAAAALLAPSQTGVNDFDRLASIAALSSAAGIAVGASRHQRRQHTGKTARHVVGTAAAVAAAASAAKVLAATASSAGIALGIQEGNEDRPGLQHKSGRKPRVVVLGSGWGAATFINGLSKQAAQMYDITLVSPRNFFLYTPLLPASALGTIEERSIVTPVRQLIAGKAKYLEAKCEYIDTKMKVVRCGRAAKGRSPIDVEYERFPEGDVEGKLEFFLDYDILVYAVGAQSNDFGTPGVKENAFFFKELPDAHKVRAQIADIMERASLPTTTPEERDTMLSFVIVGGGPTGVEVAADLADFIRQDAVGLYPELIEFVKIRLINTGDSLLSTYDRNISKACIQVFASKGVEVMAGYRVTEVTPDLVKMRGQDGKIVEIAHGMCVWAAGIKEHGLTTNLKASLVELNEGVSELNVTSLQVPARGIITDEYLQVRGSAGSIFALGDCATVRHDRTLPFAKQLFKAADVERAGRIGMPMLRELFRGASDEFPQLAEYAAYLTAVTNPDTDDDPRLRGFTSAIEANLARERKAFEKLFALTQETVGDRTKTKGFEAIAADISEVIKDPDSTIDLEGFRTLLERIDQTLQPFPPTAQVAAQQGAYLAKLFAGGCVDGGEEAMAETQATTRVFTYFHKGSLAYLGDGQAAFDLPILGAVTGPAAGVAWKLYETSAQLSWKNRALVGLDWVREGLFGRDTSRY